MLCFYGVENMCVFYLVFGFVFALLFVCYCVVIFLLFIFFLILLLMSKPDVSMAVLIS